MKWKVTSSQKLVAFLQTQLGEHSNKFFRKVLEANLCHVNGKVERFGSRVVEKGDVVELSSKWKELIFKKQVMFETIYEDESLKIINKPAGWISDEKEALKAFGEGLYLVHRLDKDTTGLLILAKSKSVLDEMISLFKKREVKKTYLCLVDGTFYEKSGTRKSFLAKKKMVHGQVVYGSTNKGLEAITHWEEIAKGKNASLISCTPLTGRTHQIRVHMAEMGHPILVDKQYGNSFQCKLFIQRPLLHASHLEFTLNGKIINVGCEMPEDMLEACKALGLK